MSADQPRDEVNGVKSMVERILDVICRGTGSTTWLIARKLGVRHEDVMAAISALESTGLLKILRCTSCESCPLRNICPYAGSGLSVREARYIVLTDRGSEICRKRERGSR